MLLYLLYSELLVSLLLLHRGSPLCESLCTRRGEHNPTLILKRAQTERPSPAWTEFLNFMQVLLPCASFRSLSIRANGPLSMFPASSGHQLSHHSQHGPHSASAWRCAHGGLNSAPPCYQQGGGGDPYWPPRACLVHRPRARTASSPCSSFGSTAAPRHCSRARGRG